MISSELHQSYPSPLGAIQAVRSRLVVSFALALAFSFAWGPFCALTHLLRSEPPTIFFSPSYYLVQVTGATILMGILTGAVWALAIGLTVWLWRRFGYQVQRWFLLMGFVALGLLGAHQLAIIPTAVPVSRIVALLTWCIISAYFMSRAVQVSAFPLALVYSLLKLADIADICLVVLVSLGLVYGVHRYLKTHPAHDLLVDSIGMMALIAITLAALLHVGVGHIVLALDMPYILALAGILVLISGILLIASGRLQRISVRSGVAGLICGLVILAGGLYSAQYPPDPPERTGVSLKWPNIVLIVWDTVRAQQLQQYGYHLKTTVVFDRLAAQGVMFERAVGTSCWTLPTHASMFTGRWPRTHAACNGGYLKLARKYDTIAELLSRAGYETVGLSANHFWAGHKAGISQGFQYFLEPRLSAEWRATPLERLRKLICPYDDGALPIKRAMRRWLFMRQDASKPFFLFINLFEAHSPYEPMSKLVVPSPGISLSEARQWSKVSPAPSKLFVEGPTGPADRARAWQGLRDLYDGEIRYMDKSTGDILNLLKGEKVNTLIIVTADHGENLGEHDLAEHQFSLHETLLHVPLVLWWPGHLPQGVRVRQRVSTIDLFATMAEAAGLPEFVYSSSQSSSLLGMGENTSARAPHKVVAESWLDPLFLADIEENYQFVAPLGRFAAPLFALYDGDWKYVRVAGRNCELLFDLAKDPGEVHDLSTQEPQRCAKMSAMLDRWFQETPDNMPGYTDGYQEAPLLK